MQENFKLLKSVLEKLHKAGCLEHLVLVGSWASYFYEFYFDSPKYRPLIRTSDVDFLVPNPRKVNPSKDLNIGQLLEELSFVQNYNNGLITYETSGLTVEFLVPEIGQGSSHPLPIEKLGITAQPLRFLNMLSEDSVTVKYEGIKIKVPDPIAYAFHKLIISGRRSKREKASKDYQTAINLIRFLQFKGMQRNIVAYFESLPKAWRAKILLALKVGGDADILN